MAETPSVDQPVFVEVCPSGYPAGRLVLGCGDPASGAAVVMASASSVMVVTDGNVARIHGGFIDALADHVGRPVHAFRFVPGEASKTMETVTECLGMMADRGLDRDSVVVGFGGGVATDIAAMAASLWMRGVRLIQVPTSLLGMADAAVGGKGAVNLPEGRNLAGCWKFPDYVFEHAGFLATLPRQEVVAGLVEIVKTAFVGNDELLCEVEAWRESDGIAALAGLAFGAAAFKARVVSVDPDDRGIRCVLNFGHTVGHALESASFYRVAHGSAVASGMAVESAIAVRMGLMDAGRRERLLAVLRRLEAVPEAGVTADAAVGFMMRDKKNSAGRIMMSLPGNEPVVPGRTHFEKVPVPVALIMECWND